MCIYIEIHREKQLISLSLSLSLSFSTSLYIRSCKEIERKIERARQSRTQAISLSLYIYGIVKRERERYCSTLSLSLSFSLYLSTISMYQIKTNHGHQVGTSVLLVVLSCWLSSSMRHSRYIVGTRALACVSWWLLYCLLSSSMSAPR